MTKEERDKLMNDPCVLYEDRSQTGETKTYWIEVRNLSPEETEEFIRSVMKKMSRKYDTKNVSGDYMLPERKKQ